MRLNVKFGLAVGLAALVTATALGTLIYYGAHNLIQKRAIHEQRATARLILDKISSALSSARRDMRIISADEFLETYLASPGYRTAQNRKLLTTELEERAKITGPWDSLEIINRHDKVLLNVTLKGSPANLLRDPLAATAIKAALGGKAYSSDAMLSPNEGQPTLLFAAPIRETMAKGAKTSIGGVVLAQYRWSVVADILKSSFPNGYAYLFNRARQIVAAHQPQGMPTARLLAQHALVHQTLAASSDHHEVVHPGQHGSRVMLTTHVMQPPGNLSDSGWGLAIEQPEDVLFAPAQQLAWEAALIVVAAMGILATMLILLGNRLTAPLGRLVQMTQRIGSGDFRQRLHYRRNDEVGALAASFDTMAEQLETQRAGLLAAKSRIQGIVDTVPDILYSSEPEGLGTTFISPAVNALLGINAEEFLRDPMLWRELLLDEDRERTLAEVDSARRQGADFTITHRFRHNDRETVRWFENRGSWERDASGRIVALHGVLTDITERKEHEETLARTSRALNILHKQDLLLTHASTEAELAQGVCDAVTDDHGYEFAWVGLLGLHDPTRLDTVAHAGKDAALAEEIRRTNAIAGSDCPACRAIRDEQQYLIQNLHQHPTADAVSLRALALRYSALIARPLISENKVLGVLNLYNKNPDVFDARELRLIEEIADNLAYGIAALRTQELHTQAQEKLAHQALHDTLTGLPNRAHLMNFLQLTVTHANRTEEILAVLFIDLDDFKLTNDTLGHPAGDELLRQVGERIHSCIRSSDVVARQGGDEFIVLMADPPTLHTEPGADQNNRLLNPARQAQRIIDRLKEPFLIEAQTTYIGASIGIAVCPHDARDADTLLRYADAAMYRAKELGKAQYAYYSEDLTERQKARVSTVNRLHKALAQNEFIVHYQPIIELSTGVLTGVEALIRWQDEDGKLVAPGAFLPVAEDTGLIIPIGEWVLKEVCRQIRSWSEEGLDLLVAVNVSARQLWHGDVAETILADIAEAGVNTDSLELEITETALSHDPQHMETAMLRFAQGGLRIALDDFGTGYSSLSRLKRLPIRTLKIDRSFVEGIPDDEDSTAIVIATMRLAHSLGMRSLAEGIETQAQAEWLLQHGCQYGQGYYFGRPAPADVITELLGRDRRQ